MKKNTFVLPYPSKLKTALSTNKADPTFEFSLGTHKMKSFLFSGIVLDGQLGTQVSLSNNTNP